MASIPLLATQIRPSADPTEQFGRIASLKSLLQQQQQQAALAPGQLQQIQEQQVQAGQIANENALTDQKSRTALMRAYSEAGGDLDKTLPLAAKYGATPDALVKLKEAALKAQSDNLDLLNKKGARALQEADLMQGEHDRIAALPPEQRPAAYQQSLGALSNAQIDVSHLPQQYPGDDAFKVMGLSLKGHTAQLADLAKQADIAKTQAETNKANSEAAGGAPVDKRELNDWLAKHPGKGPAEFMAAKASLAPTITYNLQNAGATGQGGQPSAIAQAIAKGDMKWNDAVSARTPMGVKQALLKEVKGINPDFNSGDFTVEQKVREKFTSGNVSDQLMAINTAREHMKTFTQLADALDNNDIQALNKIGNAIGVQFGSDKTTNFRIAAQAFGGEVGRAFDGAGVTAGERSEAEHNFNAALSKGQFKGAIQTVDALLAGKQRSAKQSYEAGRSGQPNFGQPNSEATATGPNGHKIVVRDGQWVDAQTGAPIQ